MFWEVFCQGIGQTLRKDDSCEGTLAIYMNYLSVVWPIYSILSNSVQLPFEVIQLKFVQYMQKATCKQQK